MAASFAVKPKDYRYQSRNASADGYSIKLPIYQAYATSSANLVNVHSFDSDLQSSAVAHEPAPMPSISRRLARWWTPEIAWLVVGYVGFIVVIVSLAWFNGRTPPAWPLGITLNTLVALFATLSRVAFMAPVIEGLGQLKWTWFTKQSRPLRDFQLFEDASRGPYSSAVLLVKMKGFLACLAAVITISGLFTSTITQQAISYPLIRAPEFNGTASVHVARDLSLWNGSDIVLKPGDSSNVKRAILDGAFTVPSEEFPHTSPICSSGDCEWPVYGSLGICSEVVNLTAVANSTQRAGLDYLASLRLGGLLNSTYALISELQHGFGKAEDTVGLLYPLVGSALPIPSGALNESLLGLITGDAVIAYSTEPMNISHPVLEDVIRHMEFLEVAFYWCSKSYATTVKDGVPSTIEVSSHAILIEGTPVGLNFPWTATFYACYQAGTCNSTIGGWKSRIEGPPNLPVPEVYEIDSWTALLTSALLDIAMYDSIFMDDRRGMIAEAGGGVAQALASAVFGEFLATEVPPPIIRLEAVRNISKNMARSLTNHLRSMTLIGQPGPLVAAGTVFVPQTFVQVRWAWISMLAVQLLLTSLFLVAVIVETWQSRVHILKGSSLATMCALDSAARDSVGYISDLDSLNRRAQTLKVQLDNRSSGMVLSPELRWTRHHIGLRP